MRLFPTPAVAATTSTPEFEELVLRGRQLIGAARAEWDKIKAELLVSEGITLVRCEPDWGGAAIFHCKLIGSGKEFRIAVRRGSLSIGVKLCSEPLLEKSALETKLIVLLRNTVATLHPADNHAQDLGTLAALLADRSLLQKKITWSFRRTKGPKEDPSAPTR